MSDFRLEVFYTVAKRLSFTKAAAELFITQPAVTKHIHELEEQYRIKLFDRNGNKITLTPAAKILLAHTEELFAIYRNIQSDMNRLSQRNSGILHIGASTTIAQYIVPSLLASFRNRYPDITLKLMNGNTEKIEAALLNKEIELGMIEGKSKNSAIKYIDFTEDDLVLVTNSSNKNITKNEITIEEFKKLPLLLREPGSGTLEVIEYALKEHNIKLSQLHVEMQLGSTEGIKSYLLHSSCVAFVSAHSLTAELQNKTLKVITVNGLSIKRSLHFIHPKGKVEALPELFIRYAQHQRNLV